jgi:hypothetical protein
MHLRSTSAYFVLTQTSLAWAMLVETNLTFYSIFRTVPQSPGMTGAC